MKTDLHSVVKRELDQHERLDYEVIDSDTLGNVVRIWSKAEELGRYVEIIRRNISDTVKEYSVVYNARTLIQTNDEEKAVEKAILAAEELAQTKGSRTPIIDLMRSAFLHQYMDDDNEETEVEEVKPTYVFEPNLDKHSSVVSKLDGILKQSLKEIFDDSRAVLTPHYGETSETEQGDPIVGIWTLSMTDRENESYQIYLIYRNDDYHVSFECFGDPFIVCQMDIKHIKFGLFAAVLELRGDVRDKAGYNLSDIFYHITKASGLIEVDVAETAPVYVYNNRSYLNYSIGSKYIRIGAKYNLRIEVKMNEDKLFDVKFIISNSPLATKNEEVRRPFSVKNIYKLIKALNQFYYQTEYESFDEYLKSLNL